MSPQGQYPCPKCTQPMRAESDQHGAYLLCRTCGTLVDPGAAGSGEAEEKIPHMATGAIPPCDISPSCLDCPLPACRHDDHQGYMREKTRRKDLPVLRSVSMGLSAKQAAEAHGLSDRTVTRIIARNREAQKT